jgi:thiosulfate/3-mercaptopyruvate sulfurtransferase
VQASLDRPDIALVNALSAEQFAGRGQPFGRPGRIPGSISVPSATLIDRTSGAFRPIDELAKAFDAAGASSYNQLITYCGGGIAASTTFVALRLLGYDNVALYDGSLLEWSSDATLPLLVD